MFGGARHAGHEQRLWHAGHCRWYRSVSVFDTIFGLVRAKLSHRHADYHHDGLVDQFDIKQLVKQLFEFYFQLQFDFVLIFPIYDHDCNLSFSPYHLYYFYNLDNLPLLHFEQTHFLHHL